MRDASLHEAREAEAAWREEALRCIQEVRLLGHALHEEESTCASARRLVVACHQVRALCALGACTACVLHLLCICAASALHLRCACAVRALCVRCACAVRALCRWRCGWWLHAYQAHL